ncbi:MAG: hypothetical protein EZS28_050929, partial [Streblomastix strix]
MTQGRKTISQIVIPKEMPFINALRYMTLNIYPTRKTYSKDCNDIVAHDCDGQILLNVKRHRISSRYNKQEEQLELIEQQRYKRISNVAEWESIGMRPGSGGVLHQTSIHMSVAHAGEYIEAVKSEV